MLKKGGPVLKRQVRTLVFKVLLSVVVALIFGELLLRLIPDKITQIDYSLAEDYRLYSSSRNYIFKPNYTRTISAIGKPMLWYFNNYGFRDHSFPTNEIKGNVFRVLFLGDSMVMGLGVESDETLPKQLENILSAKAGSKDRYIEVFNMGIVGYSTRQYQATLEEVGISFKPDLVIVGIFDNDPGEDIMSFKDKKFIWLRSLPDTIFPYPVNEYLEKNSKLFLFLVDKYYSFIARFIKDTNPTADRVLYNQGWQITEESMVNMHSLAKKASTNIAFIGIPLINEVLDPEGLPSERRERFEEITKKHFFYNFDLTPGLRDISNKKSLFLDGEDIHFSPEGNQAVAELIADYLIKEKLAPGSP